MTRLWLRWAAAVHQHQIHLWSEVRKKDAPFLASKVVASSFWPVHAQLLLQVWDFRWIPAPFIQVSPNASAGHRKVLQSLVMQQSLRECMGRHRDFPSTVLAVKMTKLYHRKCRPSHENAWKFDVSTTFLHSLRLFRTDFYTSNAGIILISTTVRGLNNLTFRLRRSLLWLCNLSKTSSLFGNTKVKNKV